jgi:peptidoglycan/xylan/chitin deacetylase (PgdA/CDA1 family)
MRQQVRTLTRALKDRPHAVGAEIGIFRGIFAQQILTHLSGIEKYYCVDPWKVSDKEHILTLQRNSVERTSNHEALFKQFKNRTKSWEKKIVILRHFSQDALIYVPDGSLDWVFIDACHSYNHSKADIIGWSKKVKVGGIISGHDFVDPGLRKGVVRKVPFGVGKAVEELVPKYQVEHITWWTVKETDSWIRA